MKSMRLIHMYLGCFFAPLLILFTVTGAYQTFDLHEPHKETGYQPSSLVKSFSQIHKNQRYDITPGFRGHSTPFRILVLLMSIALVVTLILGIIMAFRMTRERCLVWLTLVVGTVLPFVLLSFGGGAR